MKKNGFCSLVTVIATVASGCSPAIPVPAPGELEVRQISYGPVGSVELSWRLVLRMDAYLISYDDDRSGEPYTGKGLRLLRWPEGCGDFDSGVAMSSSIAADLSLTDAGLDNGSQPDAEPDAAHPDAGPPDAAAPDAAAPDAAAPDAATPDAATDDQLVADDMGPWIPADSPVHVPFTWCLYQEKSYSEAGPTTTQTPGQRPRVRLSNLTAGKTYYFAVQALRSGQTSAFGDEVAITISKERQP
jgi:hypothetical protein